MVLSVIGTAFEQCELLKERYKPFLLDVAEPLMSIDAVDSLIENEKYIGGSQNASMCLQTYDRGGLFAYRNCTLYAEKDFSKIYVEKSFLSRMCDGSEYNYFNEAVHQLARLRALYTKKMVLHAAAVVHQDNVVLFSGISGAGKSTQAKLWKEKTNSWILNYDKPIIDLSSDKVLVSGSPWGGKENLIINEVRPARALVFVHQADNNKMIRLSAGNAFSQVYLNNFPLPFNVETDNLYVDNCMRLVEKLDVYDLFCTPDEDAVRLVYEKLFGSWRCKRMYRIKDGFRLKQIANDYIVLATGDRAVKFGAAIVLNDVGAESYKMLQKEMSAEEIAQFISEKYCVQFDVVYNDVIRFLEKLVSDGVCYCDG